MIIIPHMLVGTAIGVHSNNIGMAFLFGLISHYLLDLLPHWEYVDDIGISKRKDLIKILIDFIIGLIIVSFLIWDQPEKIIIVGFALLGSLLPDFLIFGYKAFGIKILEGHYDLHHKIHYFKYLSFWQGLPATLIIIILSIFLII